VGIAPYYVFLKIMGLAIKGREMELLSFCVLRKLIGR